MNLGKLITLVFNSYGFEIKSDDGAHAYVLATKGSVNLSVGYHFKIEPLSKKDMLSFMGQANNDDAHRMIFISLGEVTEDVEKLASEGDVKIWDRPKFESVIGKALLSSTEDYEQLEANPLEEAVVEGIKQYKGDIDKVDQTQEEEKKEESEEEAEEDEGPKITHYQILKPRITKEEASLMAKKIIRGFRFDLELVPYYVFDYSCELLVEGSQKVASNSGTIAINALTSNMEEWTPTFETVPEIEIEHTKLSPRFAGDEIAVKAREAVCRLNTRTIETMEDRDSATVIESKKVEPKEDAINLDTRGVIYIPVWCVEGSNGVMIIDGTNGKVLKEDLYKETAAGYL